MNAILAEMQRQGVKGPVSVEYEHNWLESVPEIAKCVEYFEKTAGTLAQGK